MQSYLFHHQKRHGPFTLEQITSQLLPPDAMVWRQGLSGWLSPHEVPELRDELPPPDPESTEVPVSAELLEASIVPAASAPATVIRPSQAPEHGSQAAACNSPVRSAATPATVVPDKKSSIAKSTKVKEWWAKLLAAVLTAGIVLIACLIVSQFVVPGAFRNAFSGRLGILSGFVIYPAVKECLERFINK